MHVRDLSPARLPIELFRNVSAVSVGRALGWSWWTWVTPGAWFDVWDALDSIVRSVPFVLGMCYLACAPIRIGVVWELHEESEKDSSLMLLCPVRSSRSIFDLLIILYTTEQSCS